MLEKIREWRAKDLNVVLVTVAHTWGSSPRPIGSMLAWCENEEFVGSVSGGCIEDDLLAGFARDLPQQVEVRDYGVSAAQAASRGLPCGGRLSVVIEPLKQADDSDQLLQAIAQRRRLQRALDLTSGTVAITPADAETRTHLSDQQLVVVFESSWRLLIIGAGELSQYVYQFAAALGFALEVCDPRENYRESWPYRDIEVDSQMPDDFVLAANCDEQTAIVALTHDPKIDDMAIMEALDTPAFYVGSLGSRRTNDGRRARLAEHFQVAESKLAFLSGPIGIDLNTRSAAEIALSVVTEIVARRNKVKISTERLG